MHESVQTGTKGDRTSRAVPILIVGTGIALSLIIATIGSVALYQMRRDAIDNARQASENLSLTLERAIARNLQTYELSMHAVIDGMKDPEIMSLSPALRNLVLFDRSISAEDLGSMLATDDKGNLVLDSRSTPPRPVSVSDRDYFIVHKQDPKMGIFVSRPFQPRLTTDAPSIGISSRIANPDGSFGGVVVGTLRLNFFRRLFEGVELGDGGVLTLVRDDGIVIMRRPFEADVIGRDISLSPVFSTFKDLDQGTRFGTGAIDPVERLYSFRKIGSYPLKIIVGRSLDDVLLAWRKRAAAFSILIVAVDLVIVALSLLLAREWEQRVASERQLQKMVGTDGLTGLASRRALDDRADMEWRRALRHGMPLSVLMIDVDEFKAYNDHYGHIAGDDALASVSACIGGAIRRPGDIAARYGGEEFSVILPNTNASGAVGVAEAIRTAVLASRIPHVASQRQHLTVSIGAATMTVPTDFTDLRGFFQAADAALYSAKALGRNRVISRIMEAHNTEG
ncbi:sensor domain-containing diguanylate cyclase [Cupriavidus pauculus]|uniref:diguanylate cyclase n=1 Tax=Cupriavidus pauculus TaxID=82633 RepID=A0A2N5CDT2_9BURK|nr:sensor domain-containing diguanylate cyclase [Cupriavidus pauculus]PLQ00345.1 diguanylate cyclase [Cupriavidus pauculus]